MAKYLLALALVLSGCKAGGEEPVVAEAAEAADAKATSQELVAAISELTGEYICPEKLNVENLIIDFIGAGVQTNKEGHFVRLFYHASLCRDYIEIMRCPEDKRHTLTCRDGEGLSKLRTKKEMEADLNDPSDETINRKGLRDCWSSIASDSSSGCTLIGGYSDSGDPSGRVYGAEHFIDIAAPAGQKFFYLARPCVHEDRMNELSSQQNCALDVTVSNTVKEFEPYTFAEGILAAREKVARLAGRLDTMIEKAYRITLRFSEEYQKWEEQDIKRRRNKALKEGITMIVSIGAGMAAGALVLGKDGIKAGADAGQALGAAFVDVFASADDYQRSCTDCMDIKAELIEVIGDPIGTSFTNTDMVDAETRAMGKSASATGGARSSVGSSSRGFIYQEVLQQYETALAELREAQDDKLVFQVEAEKIGAKQATLGSRGGPPLGSSGGEE